MSLYEDVAKREQAIAWQEFEKNKEKIYSDILNLFKVDTITKAEIKVTLIKYLPLTLDIAIQQLLNDRRITLKSDKNIGDRGITYKIRLGW